MEEFTPGNVAKHSFMGVFYVFKLVQMVPDRATHHSCFSEVLWWLGCTGVFAYLWIKRQKQTKYKNRNKQKQNWKIPNTAITLISIFLFLEKDKACKKENHFGFSLPGKWREGASVGKQLFQTFVHPVDLMNNVQSGTTTKKKADICLVRATLPND